ncbi:MAG: pyruvate kinase [Phycisphaerales bacterium]
MTCDGATPDGTVRQVELCLAELDALREELRRDAAGQSARLDAVHPAFGASAKNLLHYLCLRRHDLRPLQMRLAGLGLSSLGRAEPNVSATLDAVIHVLTRVAGRSCAPPTADFDTGQRLLAEHTGALLGPPSPGRGQRIMVTMPSDAAREFTLVRDLLQQGMDCMRINCAHDDAPAWLRMIEHLRRAEVMVGRSCRVVMDLAGPKLRTGPVESGPAVVRVRPRRDEFGRVSAPARVWLTAEGVAGVPPSPADVVLPVDASLLAHLRVGDRVQFTDARDAGRGMLVVDVAGAGCWAELSQTAYIVPGTVLRRKGADSRGAVEACVGVLPHAEQPLQLQRGDTLVVTRDQVPGRPATFDSSGRVLTPARIGCTIPQVFDDVRAGESIWFDDGKIGGVIEQVAGTQVVVQITHTRAGGGKLRADKGINLPESALRLPALTEKDVKDLAFVAQHADVVELSFANSARDVEQLQQRLGEFRGHLPAIVLKIETRRGFDNLPDMLLAAMRWPRCGVMIARGDLAIECGFERLAEVQEEVLWICEAAHVPVIWATQVLETLAKEGMPSRAEVTDAAMGHRAECIMLNKGPHMASAVRMLDDILRRMQSHQAKKRAMLRELRLAHALSGG